MNLTKTIRTARTLWHYAMARRLRKKLHGMSREDLAAYQKFRLARFAATVLVKSPYFRDVAHLPHAAWPLMDKKLMMTEFDSMNPAGLKRDALFSHALLAEGAAPPPPLPGSFCAGLSSGTSGSRGLFVTSARERAMWAGIVLATMLPRGLVRGERIALFLRADNRLYQDVNNAWIRLAFFDLFSDFETQCRRLEEYRPTILVAPAQVLKSLALKKEGCGLAIDPALVVSAAEVLTPQDKTILARSFRKVGEIYQCTEGFLGATCEHGTMHLNEAYVHVEPEWLDDERFVPVITDFTRETQPIVRYRLDDVLAVERAPCPCGSAALAIKHIEGRYDDQLLLPGHGHKLVTVFADVCHRSLARTLPPECDYQLTQSGDARTPLLTLGVEGPPEALAEILKVCREHMTALFREQGVAVDAIRWRFSGPPNTASFQRKRRRITRTGV